MPSIFISYRRSDTGGHAGRLFERLRYWYATEELFIDISSIGWGDDFHEKIERAIRTAKAVLVVIGPDWLESINERVNQPQIDFVRREVSIALERKAADEAKIFPILVGSAGMPETDMLHTSLKEELGKLFDYNAYELPADVQQWDFQFKRLQESITQVPGIPAPMAQLSYGDGCLSLGFDDIEPKKRSVFLDVHAVQQAFGAVFNGFVELAAGNWRRMDCTPRVRSPD